MIFQYTWEKVLSGEKTQTRRLVKTGDVELVRPLPQDKVMFQRDKTYVAYPATETRAITGVERNERYLYGVDKTYAVQTARGKSAVARIRLLDIRREDARMITLEDAKAEGFDDEFEFMRTWVAMHDKVIHKQQYWGMKSLLVRPANRYDSWVLTFEVAQL